MPGRYYEEFEVGETIEHDKRRTVSESDNQRFCDMTMNQQPLHLDADFAADSQFGERLVNGLYTMSLAVGLTIPDTTDGTIVANLSYDDVEHPNPVFHGDTIYARTTVTNKRETFDGERGVVTMHVEAYKIGGASDASEPDGSPASEASGASSEHGSDGERSKRSKRSEPSEPRNDPDNDGDDTLVCEFDRTALSLKKPE